MQTFLPSESFAESARALDRARLGKQRVETLQIMKALADPAYGWQNHPAVKMWRGYECALMNYQTAVCSEWASRGYKDTCHRKTLDEHAPTCGHRALYRPAWLGDPALHLSHRSNLIRKDPVRYGALWLGTPADLPYVWPERA
jgi:hypothetical protein